MPDQVSELVKRGRELPPAERERLVDELLESLNEPAASELDCYVRRSSGPAGA